MYIMINNIIGEKQIDLAYLIKNFDWSKEVAVIGVFSDNIQCKFMEPWTIDLESRNMQIKAGTYTRKELIDLVEGKIKLTQFEKNPQINRTNKLEGITKMALNLDELSNSLLTYHVTAHDDSTHLNPMPLSIRNLRMVSSFP